MIRVSEAIKNGAKFIAHKNVVEAVKMAGDARSLKYAKDSLEILFKGEIPASAVVKIFPRLCLACLLCLNI